MTNTFTRSTSMVCAAALKADVDNLFDAMGRGPGTMSIGIYAQEANVMVDEPVSFGAHTFDDQLASTIASGIVPSGLDLAGFGLTTETATAALASVAIYSVLFEDGDVAATNFDVLVTSLGLKRG